MAPRFPSETHCYLPRHPGRPNPSWALPSSRDPSAHPHRSGSTFNACSFPGTGGPRVLTRGNARHPELAKTHRYPVQDSNLHGFPGIDPEGSLPAIWRFPEIHAGQQIRIGVPA
ncbi:hypothetical protein GCM10025778_33120 [Paeniglutamicibacter antarcticus]|uniref:Uncharacterized protein n=1 Tax=Paeniglutamicibacter antarcticus TaxID=494023 RepID=A0ABP9TSC1_9MICC